ncbi:MAG: hypothetical protein JNM17_35790 [Archangium sp.]|nr:hypothetical protein [Archangium sp.]
MPLLLLLTACAQERTHPRIADVTTPLHVSVRVVDVEVEKQCSTIPAFTDKVSCWFSKSARDGCTYVSIGESADLPIAFTGAATIAHCDFQRMRTNTAILTREPRKAARIFFDSGKTRVVIHLGDEGWLLFLKDGRLLTQEQVWNAGSVVTGRPLLPDDTPDWSRVPTLLSHLDSVSFDLSSKEFDLLMRTDPNPEEHLRDALTRGGQLLRDIEAFDKALARLKPADQQQVVDGLALQVQDGDSLARAWFRAHPQHKDVYAKALLDGVIASSVTDPGGVEELLELDPKGLDTAACEVLESHWHQNLTDPYYDGGGVGETLLSALAVIATRKVKCPWVVPILESVKCNVELRCRPAETDEESDVEVNPLDDQRRPLCTDAQLARALKRNVVTTPDEAEGEDVPQYPDWGPLLLLAAKVQGPLPEDLLSRNARRLYEWKYPQRKVLTKEQIEEEGEPRLPAGSPADEYDACSATELSVDSWVCALPKGITRARNFGCKLEIDDAKKVITFISDDEAEPARPYERPIPY